MNRLTRILLIILLPLAMVAQQSAVTDAAPESEPLPVLMVKSQFEDVSFFVETPSTVSISLPQEAEYPGVSFLDPGPFRLLDYTMLPGTSARGPVLEVRWYPLREGLETFPAIEVVTESVVYRTSPSQVLVKAPVRSDDMSLEFIPEKTTVYAGEPLKLEVVWKSSVSTKRIRSLECYPEFFNNPGIEISVPRSTDPESMQLGLPFGGRRIIARREASETSPQALGSVRFTVYLRFPDAGTITLESARLQCAQLQQDGGPLAPYAAYYNNGLFENVDKGTAYDKIYTDSEAVRIEILPLPEEGRSEAFSGLFLPCSITSEITPDSSNVGGLMELDLAVVSPVASEFIDLPSLRLQKGLRSWFKVDETYTRTWLPNGVNFSARIRALTTRVKTIPALEFQVFDPSFGSYKTLKTQPLPVSIQPQDGKEYFDASALLDTSSSLTDNEEGIWNNRGKENMHDLLEIILTLSSTYFWLLLVMGPVAFLVALPAVREARKRELNPLYRQQHAAYREFMKLPEKDPQKWEALKRLLAVSLGSGPGSWTIGDTTDRLPQAGVDAKTVELLRECHRITDSDEYSKRPDAPDLPSLKDAGQKCFNILKGASLLVMLSLIFLASDVNAQDWQSAESAFDEAVLLEPGSHEYYAAFAQTALQFEALAKSGNRPGLAWYNAGNAWFFAGEIGRAVAAYKQARVHRPFDSLVKENLNAARALSIDVVATDDDGTWLALPVRWLALKIVLFASLFWIFLLLYVRYRNRPYLSLSGFLMVLLLIAGSMAVFNAFIKDPDGVVIVPEVYARKGPAYTYHTAFHEPLHDGLEFTMVDKREEWMQIRLSDGRICWIPESQAQLIEHAF